MAASPFTWATPERASRLLRLLILILLVMVPVAAIYSLLMAGVGHRDVIYFRNEDGPLPGGEELRLEGLPSVAPDARREVIEQCSLTNGERKCTRTERTLKPGEQLGAPQMAPPAAPPATPQHSNFIKAAFTPESAPDSNRTAVSDTVINMRVAPSVNGGMFHLPVAPPAAGGLTLSVLALLLLMGILFNLERLLHAFETGSVFAEATVRRLQHVGIFVAALGFLPQIDIFELLRSAAMSLLTPAPVGGLPMIPDGGINIALILAGVFTVLIARIVHESIALAEDVRGTV